MPDVTAEKEDLKSTNNEHANGHSDDEDSPSSSPSSSPSKGEREGREGKEGMEGNESAVVGAEIKSNIPTIKSKSETSIPKSTAEANAKADPKAEKIDDDDDKETSTKSARRNRRKFVVNQRGFMGVTSMDTAKLVDEYQLLQVLGQGFYGKVYLATSVNASTGEMLAVKQLDDRKFLPEQFDMISSEFNSLHRIINRNIVSYKQILLDENLIYVVTEFVDNGSIYDLIQKNGPIPEAAIARFTKQIVAGLSHLQDLSIVHRNLKCSNVLLTKSWECKITDFELSHKHESNRYTIRGAPYWMAPEVIEMTATPTCASDIWGLGCMIVEMLTGEPPYRKMGPMTALLSISRDDHPPLPETISSELKDFLSHCFVKDPTQRYTAKMLKEHAFLTQELEPVPASTTPSVPVRFMPHNPSTQPSSPTPLSTTPPTTSSTPSATQSTQSTTQATTPSATQTSQSTPRSTTQSASTTPASHPASSQSSESSSTSSFTPVRSASSPARHISLIAPITPHSQQHLSMYFDNKNIVIDVYTEQDKEDFDLLEMTSSPSKLETSSVIDDKYQFKTPAFTPKPESSELDALKDEIQYLRRLNEENVAAGQRLKEKYKKNLEVQEQLTGLAWRLRNRTDAAVENMRQAAKATAHSNMLLKRTNQVATESLAHGAIVTANIRKLEEYVLEGDPAGKKLMGIVFKKSVTPEILVNPTISGYLWYNPNLRTWKKDKEKRAWFVLKDNFLFAFKSDKGVAVEGVYLGEGARLVPMSEDQCKKKFCFRVADIFLIATDTAELCSEWMLALSKPQKWYESSYEDTAVISPRAGRKGSDENVHGPDSPTHSNQPTHAASPSLTSTPASHNHKLNKSRSGSSPALPASHAPVFGVPIEELFARESGNVPYFLLRIIQFLEEKGLQEEGILRISGSLSEINGLKDALQHGEDVDYSSHDPHAVAGLLKVFFRELPAPIIPEPYHSRILEVMFNQEILDDQRVVEVKMILDQLPAPNRALLKILMSFLVHVNCNADKNKMTIQNLITCMVPTIRCVPGVFMYVIPNFDFVFDVD